MRGFKEIAIELCVVYADTMMQENSKLFLEKLSDVFVELAINDVQELHKIRNISNDNGLISIFKEQRQKYSSICEVVNQIKANLVSIVAFDEVIKEFYPAIYEWYVSNVIVQTTV